MTAINCISSVVGDGPALFFIHGIGSCRQGWNEVISYLKDEFTCISYDLRGHGESPVPACEFGLSDLVEDLEALRVTLGIECGHFFGHSLGGMIGPAYARAYPDRVLSVGLLSTAAFRTDNDTAKVQSVLLAMQENGIEKILGTLVDRWFTEEFLEKNPEKIEARIKQVLDTDPDVFLNVFRIYAETEMSPWLHEITQPCLVLTGENDGGCNPRLNQLMADALPSSDLVILENLKHSLMIEASPLLASHILSFLSIHK